MRYILRELTPRAILLAVCLGILLPLLPIGYHFGGGIFGAAALGVAFTAGYMFVGNILFWALNAVVDRFGQNIWMVLSSIVIMLLTSAGFLRLAGFIPGMLSITSATALICASVVCTVACVLTHDYGSAKPRS
jgi:hypothetical protein